MSADSEGKAMDEPVRWVSKEEEARELEVSLSTLDRKVRKGGPQGLRADARAGVSGRRRAAAPCHHQGGRA